MTKLDVCIKWLGKLIQAEDARSSGHDSDMPHPALEQFQQELAGLKPKPPAPKLPPISFDLATAIFTVPSVYLDLWSRAYPAVNLWAEIEAAAAWLVANPKKAPRSSYSRFLNGWLARTQQRGGTRGFIQSAAVDKAESWAKS